MLKKISSYLLASLIVLSYVTTYGISQVNGEETYSTGYHHVESYGENSEESTSPQLFRRSSLLPSSYKSKVTSVKDQGSYGVCWAFGMINNAEASMISNGKADTSIDYSEQQLAYFSNSKHVTDPLGLTAGDTNKITGDYMMIGGNNLMSTMIMSNWIGASLESKAPYASSLTLDDDLAYDDVAQLKNGYFFAKDETRKIKEHIQNQGSVNVAFYALSYSSGYPIRDYNNTQIVTYYNDTKSEEYANHVVSIVGWDDNIPANLFQTSKGHTPRNNGGWLIKNSWGTSFGIDGYFYISYEDSSLCEFVGGEYETANTYDNNYHYDSTGNVGSGYDVANGDSIANIYTVQGDATHKETLSRIGFTLASKNTNYSIQVYKNPQANQPESGTAMLPSPATGFIEERGYSTVDIPSIILTGGETFSIVITLSTTNGNGIVKINTDEAYSYTNIDGRVWISGTVNAEPGQCFVSGEDIAQDGCVNRIKAFTKNNEASYSSKKSFSKATIQPMNEEGINGNEATPLPIVTYNNKTLILNEDYVLSYKNNTQTGTGYVTASGIGEYTGFVSQTFAITNREWSVNTIPAQIYTGSALTPTITVQSNDKVLMKDKDYTVSYTNNTYAGVASVLVTGIGDYKGTQTVNFTINPASLSTASLSQIASVCYTGSALYPSVSVTMGGKTLVGGQDYTLSYSQNINPGTGYLTVNGKGNYTGSQTQSFSILTTQVSYRTHVQDYGWQGYVFDGQTSGTSGQSKRLEGINIKLDNTNITGGITYRTHIQDYGWQDWKSDNVMSGTSGQSKRLEAIQIKLTGEVANQYDVYYRVHAQNFGWLDWAKNGDKAGSAGYSYRLEAIQIKVVPKGSSAPGEMTRAYVQRYIRYNTHVQDYGWQDNAYDGEVSGTTGQSKRLEGIHITLDNPIYSGTIQYKTHVQDYGWQNWVTNGNMAGTTGQSKRLEAIQIKLTGEMANQYDIYYRVHAQNFGWMGWAKNGASAGSAGYSYRLEGIQIILVSKGGSTPGSTSDCFRQK